MSGRKNTLLSFPLYSAVPVSSTTTYTSPVTNIQYLDNVGVQVDFTSTPTGTLTIEVSATYKQDDLGNVTNAGTWVPLSFLVAGLSVTSVAVTSGSPSPIYADLFNLSAPWIRVRYVNASSSGTISGVITAKMI